MLLLLGKGFFMGVLIATYQIGAETLFVNVLGDEELSKAFFFAGFAGILSTVLFVYLQRKINYSSLVLSTSFIILLFIGGIRLAFEFVGENDISNGHFRVLLFTLFVMIGPITTIILLGFWGVFGRIFDLRQSKRIIGGIDTGQLMATMIAFYSIPLLRSSGLINETYDLLLMSSLAALGVFVFTLILTLQFNLNKATAVQVGDDVEKVNFYSLFTNKYLRLLSVFLIFSMAVAVFVDFTFLSATDTMYPDEEDLSNFLSFFSGTVIICSFIIQSFLNDYIIGKFGLKVALMTMPFILILFTLGAIVAGHIFGYETKNNDFILFFVLIGTGKLFTAALKDALENPAFKLFFLPIDIKIRFDVQSMIEGVVNQVAVFVAGALQIALGLLVFFKLIHYSYFILGLAGIVVYLSIKLFNEYKNKLKSSLEKEKENLSGSGKRNENSFLAILNKEIKSKEVKRVLNALKIFEMLNPVQFEFMLLDLINRRQPEIRAYAYKKLGDRFCWDMLDVMIKDMQTEENTKVLSIAKKTYQKLTHLSKTYEKLQEKRSFSISGSSYKEWVRSTDAEKRIIASKLLVKPTEDKHILYMVELMRDINPKVRTAAIVSAGKLKRPELIPVLIENLHNPTYGNAAASALLSIGGNSFYSIDNSFYKTGQHLSTMLRIIQIISQVGGKEAVDLLWKKINFPDRKIVSQLLLGLSYNGFRAHDFQSAKIKLSLESEVGDIAWNIKALLDVPEDDPMDSLIRESLDEENLKNYETLFILLSMLYDPQNVTLARNSIMNGTSEGITFAVEMMDIFIEDELKDKILPVLDEMKVRERLAKLQNNYPPEIFESYPDLLTQIINRDFNRINRYTKALAIYRLGEVSTEVSDTMVALLFSSDKLLLQTAAFAIFNIDKDAYHHHTKRLKPAIKKQLDADILPPAFKEEGEFYHQKLLLIEKVMRIKKLAMFSGIPGDIVTNMAEGFDEIRLGVGEVIMKEGDAAMNPLTILLDGEVDIYRNDELVTTMKPGGLLGHKSINASDLNPYGAIVKKECTALVMGKEILQDLMSKYVPILECWIGILNDDEIKEEEIVDILY